jgi:hypothetical protein
MSEASWNEFEENFQMYFVMLLSKLLLDHWLCSKLCILLPLSLLPLLNTLNNTCEKSNKRRKIKRTNIKELY